MSSQDLTAAAQQPSSVAATASQPPPTAAAPSAGPAASATTAAQQQHAASSSQQQHADQQNAAAAGSSTAAAGATGGAAGGGQQRAGNEYEAGVQDVQFLLEALSMQAERPVLRLSQLSSSFFVLAFRQLFGDVPPGVNVSPASAEDRVSNARAVIESLESKLNQSLAHISPEGVAQHDEKHISMLLRVFVDIVTPPGGSRLDDTNEDGSHTSQPSSPQVMVRDWLTGLYGQQGGGGGGSGGHHHHHHHPPHHTHQQHTGGYDTSAAAALAAGAGAGIGADHQHGGADGDMTKDARTRIRRIASLLSRGDVPRYQTSVCDRLVDSDGRLVRHFTGDGPQSTIGIASHHRPSSAPTMAKRPLPAMANARRDAKIERLRSEKFLQRAQDQAIREVVRQASREEVRMVKELKVQLHEQRQTFLSLDKLAKEKDERLREIYQDNVMSAIGAAKGKGMRLNLHRNAADLVRRERGLVEQERDECEREIRLQFEMLRAKREAYLSHLSSWRVSVLKQDSPTSPRQDQRVSAAAS